MFLHTTVSQNFIAKKEKKNKTAIKSCTSSQARLYFKDTIEKVKKQPTEQEEIFTNHIQ